MAHLSGRQRAAFVQSMFERIAARYDLMNRLMTLGQDHAWRRVMVDRAHLPHGGRLLDVATGTGDIAFEALARDDTLRVAAADFALAMMRAGRVRPGGQRPGWCASDALALPFPAACFDAVTSGYLVRNVIDVAGAFREQLRVARPGGWVVCLDTSPPPPGLLRPFILFYLKVGIPLLGRLIAGDSAAYTYLPESTRAFKTPAELASIMRDAGLEEVGWRTFMFGTMALHWGRRPL